MVLTQHNNLFHAYFICALPPLSQPSPSQPLSLQDHGNNSSRNMLQLIFPHLLGHTIIILKYSDLPHYAHTKLKLLLLRDRDTSGKHTCPISQPRELAASGLSLRWPAWQWNVPALCQDETRWDMRDGQLHTWEAREDAAGVPNNSSFFCGRGSGDHLKVNQRRWLDLDSLSGFPPSFITRLARFVHMHSLLIYYV